MGRGTPDFLIVGAGAAGGILARELATAGFRVVVLEQGPYLRKEDFRHDELAIETQRALTNDHRLQPNTFRRTEAEIAIPRPVVGYGRAVGGGSVHFTANYWRFHEIDFHERSVRDPVPGTGFDDWPISYAELEPYYTRAEWELGISGLASAKSARAPAQPPLPAAAPPDRVHRDPDRAGRAQAGLDRIPGPDGDPFPGLSGPPRLHPVRLLRDLRLRGRRQVKYSRGHDPPDGAHRPL